MPYQDKSTSRESKETTELEKTIRSVLSPNSYIVPSEGIALLQAITQFIQQAELRGLEKLWADAIDPDFGTLDVDLLAELVNERIFELTDFKKEDNEQGD